MAIAIFALFWLMTGLFAAALLAALINRNGGAEDKTARALLISSVAAGAVMILAMVFSRNYPKSYTLFNAVLQSLILILMVIFNAKKHATKHVVTLSAAVALYLVGVRIYVTPDLGLQPVAPHVPTVAAFLFFHLYNLAVAYFAYCFCLSAAHYIEPGRGAGAGLKQAGLLYRSALWGFIVFSVCQVAGSAWSLTAGWSDYWVWGTSHIFSAVLWIYYAAMLHVPSTPRLSPKAMPVMGIIGFVLIIVNSLYGEFVIVPVLGY